MDKIKKLLRVIRGIRGKKTDTIQQALLMQEIAEELADVVIATDLLSTQLGIDLAGAVPAKFNKTSEKVGIKVFFGD